MMSIQTCLPSNCKSQHSVRVTTKSPSFLRHGSSGRQNAVNRRSAVERLEESKANYVKSERVLDAKQEFKNSSHLHVSTGPQLDIKLKTLPKHNIEFGHLGTSVSIDLKFTAPKSCLQQRNLLPHKSPPLPRVRAKSQSESRDTTIRRNLSFASHGNYHKIGALVDVESQLKRLINSGSKENIIASSECLYSTVRIPEAQAVPKVYKTPPELPKVRRGYSDPTHKGGWGASDYEPKRFSVSHKSLPDLSPPFSIQPQVNSFCSDNSDDSIFQNCVPVVINRTPVQCTQPRIQSPVRHTEGAQEVRRFSNGTGTLHLTPYCPSQPNATYQRRSVIRSKSDVSHRYTKKNSEYYVKRNNNYTTAEIERFFDTMGLDTTVWHHITSPSSISSPPCFFDSASSIDSNDRSSTYSEESNLVPSKDGLRNFDLKGHGPLETSIVEKNARVIKWLYNCRKAAKES